MLGLNLRQEFKGKRLKGTAIELSNESNTGATQIAAAEFLEITYPTHDLLKGIEAVGPNQGRPVVVIGERGLGKSHLMAALYHAVHDPVSTGAWLKSWATILNDPAIGAIPLRQGMLVIGESLHRQRYKFLWDLLFEQHPHGNYIRGKWEGMGSAKTDIPSDQLILELLRHTPTMLLLDEFQTWYDGLTNTKQYPWKNWAFNFIQILSEISKEHPDLLALVVSVRNGDTDAYQQIHRVNPVQIDFKAGGSPERIQHDRRRMLLHRLFENRIQIPTAEIDGLIAVHVSEFLRLLNIPASEHDRTLHEGLLRDRDLDIEGRERLYDEAREMIHSEWNLNHDALGRLVHFLSAAVADRHQRVVKVDDATYDLQTNDGKRLARFSIDREMATSRDDIDLLGLDHRLMQDELGRWRSLPPEEIGISVRDGAEAPLLLSFWLVESSTGNGERRVAVQIIGVRPDGTRVPAAERQADRYVHAPPGAPAFTLDQRRELFQTAVEPTLQRELKHKGGANGAGSYQATLIGYVEAV